jgi:hypothetical protein
MIKHLCYNCLEELSSYEELLNKRHKLDHIYCKECMFGFKLIVENKYDIEKLALEKKGYKSWSEWGDYRRNPRKHVEIYAKSHGIN